MKRIRPFLAATATLAIAAAPVLLPVLTSATPASATATCTGTSLESFPNYVTFRVPTVGNAHPNQWLCILGYGDSSTAVARLQIDLNDCYGFLLPAALAVDGIYGTNTENAVKAVQRYQGWPPAEQDGIYGPNTIESGFEYQIANADPGQCVAFQV
jgi:peptidoglycan hydrolase-like protein with peptidoglycan-binding domain